jgi:hypothetical protein
MPPFTKVDMKRFRDARADSIWDNHRDVSGDEDALVILRHDIVQECRRVLQAQITQANADRVQAQSNDCLQEVQRHEGGAEWLQKAHKALEDLIDKQAYHRLRP